MADCVGERPVAAAQADTGADQIPLAATTTNFLRLVAADLIDCPPGSYGR
jgi:hypothetical protein